MALRARATHGQINVIGKSSYVYIAYASSILGADFTLTNNPSLGYCAILGTDTKLTPPVLEDFEGLWYYRFGTEGSGGGSPYETAYDGDIIGNRDSSNTVFTIGNNYVSGSPRVHLNGLRLQKGGSMDYMETQQNQITLNYAPQAGDTLLIDYIKLN